MDYDIVDTYRAKAPSTEQQTARGLSNLHKPPCKVEVTEGRISTRLDLMIDCREKNEIAV